MRLGPRSGSAHVGGALLALLALGCAPARPIVVHALEREGPPAECREARVAVQVLGSGGPIAGADGRAGSGYLVWVDGHARALIDLGPGVSRQFGRSGAEVADLDALLLSHLHVDHSADLAAFLKSASFSRSRERPLTILGPRGGGAFPAATAFVAHTLAPGGYAYLGYERGRPFALEVRDLPTDEGSAHEALVGAHVRVRSIGVPHGPVPALGFEVSVGETRVVFMGDQRLDAPGFAELLRGADLFVAHLAIAEGTEGAAAGLHATPSRIGEVAATAGVGRLVLSHLMGRALRDLEGALTAIGGSYRGPVDVADDGLCVRLR